MTKKRKPTIFDMDIADWLEKQPIGARISVEVDAPFPFYKPRLKPEGSMEVRYPDRTLFFTVTA